MAKKTKELAPQSLGAVRKAREALRGKAMELLLEYQTMIKQAVAAGEWEAALKAQQWLIDHVPAEDGERIFDSSVDKSQKQVDAGPKAPVVQIGIKLGGLDLDAKQIGAGKLVDGEVVESD